MIASERRQKIAQMVEETGVVSIEALCRELGASRATIRRDLISMDSQRLLRRTRGGAVAIAGITTDEEPVSKREQLQREEKERLAEAAAERIHEGAVLYIGAGTTMRMLAGRLYRFRQLTVLTNDLGVAAEVSRTGNALIVAGGTLKKGSLTLTGILTEQALSQLHVDIAFLSADAVDTQSGYMDYNTDEIKIKRMMMENAKHCIMLCDHTKFRKAAFMRIAAIGEAEQLVTGCELDETILDKLKSAGINVKIC